MAAAEAQPRPSGLPLPAFESLLAIVEADIACGVRAAQNYKLHTACEPTQAVTKYLNDVLSGGASGSAVKDWRCVMNKRIGMSYKERRDALVWLDDKLEQVAKTASCFEGRELHLPIYAYGDQADEEAIQRVCDDVCKRAAVGEAIVVKPRHGSNSKEVALWPQPQDVSTEVLTDSVRRAARSHDKSWDKESWNQNAVPKGVVVQPMYAPLSRFLEEPTLAEADPNAFSRGVCHKFLRPMELKVQVLFGEVVGGQLNTHPQYLWVCRAGHLHVWDQSAEGFVTRHAREPEEMPPGLVELLQQTLREHWHTVRGDSERLARAAGLDELRIDWLLCDPRWGPRIGELTYMGTFAIDLVPVSIKLARAFAHAHLSRLGQPVLHAW